MLLQELLQLRSKFSVSGKYPKYIKKVRCTKSKTL